MSSDTSKSEQRAQALTSEPHSTQAELHRTRVLLRAMLEALLDDGFTFHRESPMSIWWNEDKRRPKVDA